VALSLSEIDDLYTHPGVLFSRVRAAAAAYAKTWYANAAVSAARQAWAAQFTANPTGVATPVYYAVITDPSIAALTAGGIREGSAPTDAAIVTLVGAILTQFVGA
jgi:hypothetical protein